MTTDSAERTWSGLTSAMLSGRDLDREDTAWAMQQLLSGEASDISLAGFLIALRAKGETVAEMSGFVDAMLAAAVQISVPGPIVDIVGTGGDRARTVNISTMAAVVVAAAGERVVKHGNRAASSASGSADVLEALGVALDLAPEAVAQVAVDAGITFCFAQRFHPAFRHAATARRELAVPTAFNFLGPLVNPARPAAHAVGVADRRMAPIMAGVLAERGDTALVFRGEDGIDELTVTSPSEVWLAAGGQVTIARVDPRDLGIDLVDPAALRGGDAETNAGIALRTWQGERGPVRDAVVLNAAAALTAAEWARGGTAADATADSSVAPDGGRLAKQLLPTLAAQQERAAAAIDDGRAAALVERWVAVSRAARS
ncbi:MAG: anthranilate phosphoribosyltransferase [Actinomycetales bacterium]